MTECSRKMPGVDNSEGVPTFDRAPRDRDDASLDTRLALPPLFRLFCGGGGSSLKPGFKAPFARKTTSRQRPQSSSSS